MAGLSPGHASSQQRPWHHLQPCPTLSLRSHEEFTDHDLKWATRMTCGYW